MEFPRSVRPILFCLFFAAALWGQAPQVPTIKSEARIVVVDVIATDSNGNPVKGLSAKDFTVYQDKKEQQVRSFDEHKTSTVDAPAAMPKLPPNTYTNYIPVSARGPVNILLFDTLNTEQSHLEFAKQQLISFLRHLPPHREVALFVLGTELHMVQGFTSESDDLIAAAGSVSILPSKVLKTTRDTASEISNETEHVKSPKMRAAMIRFLVEEHGGHSDAQVAYTMEAMEQLARAVAVIPGRKNLIWVSDSFPFSFAAGMTQGREHRDAVRRLASLLAATQIAVFPVDARGLASSSPDASITGHEIFLDMGGFPAAASADINLAYQSMATIAEETGGRVYHNTNDLEGAFQRSIDLGSNYYSLSFRPDGIEWNGGYHALSVKCSKPVKLAYRAGYYAVPDPLNVPHAPASVLNAAMMSTVPAATVLLMQAQVVPPADESQPVTVDVLFDPHDLAFTDQEGKKALSLRMMMVAWTGEGKSAAAVGGDLDPKFDPPALAGIMRGGMRIHQTIKVKPGSYTLRIGVIDRNSGRLGTLDVPLTIPATTAKSN